MSLSQGVVTMVAGGLGGAACAAAGLGGGEPAGFCSSAICAGGEDHYTYQLPGGSVKRSRGWRDSSRLQGAGQLVCCLFRSIANQISAKAHVKGENAWIQVLRHYRNYFFTHTDGGP